MTDSEKLDMLKAFLDIDLQDSSQDDLLAMYLKAAQQEIIAWHFAPHTLVDYIPAEFEMIQIQAVVAGYNIRGAENQKTHNENGINRTFHYTDMVQYIHNNISGYARVL